MKGEQRPDKGVHSVYHAKMHDPIDNYRENPHKHSKGTCHFLKSRLPTAVVTVNGKEVRVSRDTGCTGVVVRRSLVSDGQMLNKQSGVTLINNYMQRCPVARINIDCPFIRDKMLLQKTKNKKTTTKKQTTVSRVYGYTTLLSDGLTAIHKYD